MKYFIYKNNVILSILLFLLLDTNIFSMEWYDLNYFDTNNPHILKQKLTNHMQKYKMLIFKRARKYYDTKLDYINEKYQKDKKTWIKHLEDIKLDFSVMMKDLEQKNKSEIDEFKETLRIEYQNLLKERIKQERKKIDELTEKKVKDYAEKYKSAQNKIDKLNDELKKIKNESNNEKNNLIIKNLNTKAKYQDKINKLQTKLIDHKTDNAEIKDEYFEYKINAEKENSKLKALLEEYQNQVVTLSNKLQNKINDLSNEFQLEKQSLITNYEEKISTLKEDVSLWEQKYTDIENNTIDMTMNIAQKELEIENIKQLTKSELKLKTDTIESLRKQLDDLQKQQSAMTDRIENLNKDLENEKLESSDQLVAIARLKNKLSEMQNNAVVSETTQILINIIKKKDDNLVSSLKENILQLKDTMKTLKENNKILKNNISELNNNIDRIKKESNEKTDTIKQLKEDYAKLQDLYDKLVTKSNALKKDLVETNNKNNITNFRKKINTLNNTIKNYQDIIETMLQNKNGNTVNDIYKSVDKLNNLNIDISIQINKYYSMYNKLNKLLNKYYNINQIEKNIKDNTVFKLKNEVKLKEIEKDINKTENLLIQEIKKYNENNSIINSTLKNIDDHISQKKALIESITKFNKMNPDNINAINKTRDKIKSDINKLLELKKKTVNIHDNLNVKLQMVMQYYDSTVFMPSKLAIVKSHYYDKMIPEMANYVKLLQKLSSLEEMKQDLSTRMVSLQANINQLECNKDSMNDVITERKSLLDSLQSFYDEIYNTTNDFAEYYKKRIEELKNPNTAAPGLELMSDHRDKEIYYNNMYNKSLKELQNIENIQDNSINILKSLKEYNNKIISGNTEISLKMDSINKELDGYKNEFDMIKIELNSVLEREDNLKNLVKPNDDK